MPVTVHYLRVLWYDHHSDEGADMEHQNENNHAHHEANFEHCVNIIRQNLTCNFDGTIAIFSWLYHTSEPSPYFGNFRTCRNFNMFREWPDEHPFLTPEGFVWEPPETGPFVDVMDRIPQQNERNVDKNRNKLHSYFDTVSVDQYHIVYKESFQTAQAWKQEEGSDL